MNQRTHSWMSSPAVSSEHEASIQTLGRVRSACTSSPVRLQRTHHPDRAVHRVSRHASLACPVIADFTSERSCGALVRILTSTPSRIHRRLPTCDIECTCERAAPSRNVENFYADSILRQGFPKRCRRRKAEFLPQGLRWNKFAVPTRQARFKFVNKVSHRGILACSRSDGVLELPR